MAHSIPGMWRGAAAALALGISAALAPFASAPASAQFFKSAPNSRAEIQASFAPLVKQVAPAVVNVYGTRVQKGVGNSLFDDPFFRRFFGDAFGGPSSRVQQSVGSGVIVDTSGLVVTNNHVIEGMTEVKVSLSDRREFEVDVVLRDPRSDLAVLKFRSLRGKELVALQFGDADRLEVGDLVLAIGNPFGVGQTVTQGIVSGLARTQIGAGDYQSFIQTDAAINPGNSGGALVDMSGRLIGINTAIYSQSGGSHGIGFAIPASMVRAVVESARGGAKTVRRPWLGARVQAVSSDLADGLGLDRPTGVLVARVDDKGPAAEAGLKRGDVILTVDGQEVDDPEAFGYRFVTRPIGSTSTFGVLRNGKPAQIAVKLVHAPETRAREELRLSNRSPLSGANVVNLSPATAEEIGVDSSTEGVAVLDLAAGSTAENVGFKKGDIILAVNGRKVATTRDLQGATQERQRYWEITISRDGQVVTSAFGG